MANKKTNKKPEQIRFKLSELEEMVRLGHMQPEQIQSLRDEGRVIEPRKKEIRYIPGTTLIPHFSFRGASKQELTVEAIALRVAVEKVILTHTVSKEEQDRAIAEVTKAEEVKKETPKSTAKTEAKKPD